MWLTLVVIGAVSYVLTRRLWNVPRRPKMLHSPYARPGPWHVLKLITARLWLVWRLVRTPRVLDVYKPTDMEYDKTGLTATEVEKSWEAAKQLNHRDSMDSMFVCGTDGAGTFLTMKIERRINRQAQVVFIFTLADGTSYQLPGAPDTLCINTDGKQPFQGGGIKFVMLEAMRKWRITFNGLAKKTVKNEESIVHLRMNMIWAALNRPFEFKREFSRNMLAQGMAREIWRGRRNWRQMSEPLVDGFDQWGVLHGTYREGNANEVEFYLRGLRQRRWGQPNPTTLHRRVELIGLSEDGDLFYINGSSDSARLTHEVWGHSMHPSGVFNKINVCDLDLEQMGEFGPMPSSFSVRFAAKGRQYHALVYSKPDSFVSFEGRPWHHQTTHFHCQLALNGQQGRLIMLATDTFKGECPLGTQLSVPYLGPPSRELKPSEEDKLVLLFGEEACQFEALVGGKGSSLALTYTMTENGVDFEVPAGFCLTLKAWKKQTDKMEDLQKALKEMEQVARGLAKGNLEECCTKAARILSGSLVDKDIQDHVREALVELFGEDFEQRRIAVRSSAIGEDGEDLSSAGQNLTVLGCKGFDEIVDGVRKCWSSLLEFRSVEYRRQHGQELIPGMGVVIQEMVDADLAGVLFTVDPVSGDPGRIYITANFGLGESVVSGQTEPDTLILQRTWDDRLSLLERTPGKKDVKIVMKDSGVEEVQLTQEESAALCLKDDLSLKLGRIGILLEKSFGNPRDLEFAVVKEKVYLLQSRPITTLDSWTDYEIRHENDTPVLTSQEIFTTANVSEVMPGCISTLSQTVCGKMFELGMQRAMKGRYGEKYDYNPWYQGRFLGYIESHSFINMIELMLRENQPQITDMNRAGDISFFGHLALTPEMHRIGVHRHGVVDFREKMKGLKGLVLLTLFGQKRIDQAEKKFSNYKIDIDQFTDSKSLFKHVCSYISDLIDIGDAHSIATISGSVWQSFCFLALLKGKDDWTAEFNTQMSQILSAIKNVESANVPASLEEISEAIIKADTKESKDFPSMTSEAAAQWLQSDSGSPGLRYREFLRRHGHRGMKEFDMYIKPWSLDNQALITVLQAMVKSNRVPAAKPKETFDWQQWLDTTKPSSYRFLKFAIPRARKGVCLREQTKTLLIRTINALRLGYIRVGQLLASEGKLPDPELMFFLTQTELTHIVENGYSPYAVGKALKRRKAYPTLDALIFPKFIKGVPKPIEDTDVTAVQQPKEGTLQLQGTPGCQGQVRARVRVVLNIRDAVQLQSGEILITRGTDIGWGPYFALLGGLVTEVGGLISHGVVVAREYGLPCIIGAHNATKMFKTGDLVILDGTKGTLTLVDDAE